MINRHNNPLSGELSLSGRRTGQSEPGGDGQTARVGAETATGQRPESAELGADARNWSYTKYPGKGSFNIVPDFAYDDGRFTFVGFSPSKSIPSVTKELNGKEHVVNSSIQKKGDFTVLVIQEVTPRLVLRSGNAVVGLENSGFGKVHAADGSTVSRQVERVEKPESN